MQSLNNITNNIKNLCKKAKIIILQIHFYFYLEIVSLMKPLSRQVVLEHSLLQ